MALTKEDLQAIRDLMREEITAETGPIKADIAELKADNVELKADQAVIRKSQLKVELEQFPKIKAALDGMDVGKDKNFEQDRRLVILEDKVESHDDRIISLELAAKAK